MCLELNYLNKRIYVLRTRDSLNFCLYFIVKYLKNENSRTNSLLLLIREL